MSTGLMLNGLLEIMLKNTTYCIFKNHIKFNARKVNHKYVQKSSKLTAHYIKYTEKENKKLVLVYTKYIKNSKQL